MNPSIEQEIETKADEIVRRYQFPFDKHFDDCKAFVRDGSYFGFSLAMREAQVLVEFIEHAEMFSQCIVTRMRAKQALEQFKERTGNGNR